MASFTARPFLPDDTPASPSNAVRVRKNNSALGPTLPQLGNMVLNSAQVKYAGCHKALDIFRKQNASSLSDIDTKRLDILVEAVAEFDIDFIALHQIFSLLHKDKLRVTRPIRNHPLLGVACSVFNEVLDSTKNESFSLEAQQFFSNFPRPIEQLPSRSYELQELIFLQFVSRSINFPKLRWDCGRRKYPPVVGEIFDHIGVASVILQRRIFNTIVRHLSREGGIGNPTHLPFENEALHIFIDNQKDFFRRQKSNRISDDCIQTCEDQYGKEMEAATFGAQLRNLCKTRIEIQERLPVLYQYIKSFAQGPIRLPEIGEWQRSISVNDELLNISEDRFRLRVIEWAEEEPPSEHDWATANTIFPPCACFTFNGTVLRIDRRSGKDLPMDVTAFIKEKNEDDHVLEIVLGKPNDTSLLNYFLAIEVVGTKSHNDIKRNCFERNHISAAAVVETIQGVLNTASTEKEVTITQSSLSITLSDITSSLPVRSKVCLHNECFDLELFLQSLKQQNCVSTCELWRCPICGSDARPQFLIGDGFLQNVQENLAKRGLFWTRAITVRQDGKWKPKEYHMSKELSDAQLLVDVFLQQQDWSTA